MCAVVKQFEQGRRQKRLAVCQGRGRSSDLKNSLVCQAELAGREILREDLFCVSSWKYMKIDSEQDTYSEEVVDIER